MEPDVRPRKPRIALASVVLPLPLSPATVVIVAGRSAMVRLRSRSATTGCVPPSRPPPSVLVAWLICSRGARPSTPAGASRSLAGLATSAAEATDAQTPSPALPRVSARGAGRGVLVAWPPGPVNTVDTASALVFIGRESLAVRPAALWAARAQDGDLARPCPHPASARGVGEPDVEDV